MLKSIVIAAASLVAAGSNAALATTSYETAITDLEIDAGNSGINPSFLAVEISGRVELGYNRCSAAGRSVELVQSREGDVIEVRAIITEPQDAADRICTQEYDPQIAYVKTTVRDSWLTTSDIIIKNVNEMGHDVSAFDLTTSDAITFDRVDVTVVNAGINPDAFAYRIDGVVIKGSNPCVAANTEVSLLETRLNGRIVLQAVRRVIDPDRLCTMEYNPVFVTLTATVRGIASETDEVIVKNVGQLGNDVSVQDLL